MHTLYATFNISWKAFVYSPQINIKITEKELNSISENINKKLSYCWETVRRESMPRIAEMDVEMTT